MAKVMSHKSYEQQNNICYVFVFIIKKHITFSITTWSI